MRRLPALLAAITLLAACAAPPPAPDETEPAIAGLSAGQLAQLRALGVPVLIPGDLGAFQLEGFEVDRQGPSATYAMGYRRADGACFEVSGATDGLGGPGFPLVSTAVRLVNVPGAPAVRVYEAADDPLATSAQVWGVGTVVSEFIELDGMTALFLSDTVAGCRPVTLEEGAEIVSALRLLPPAGGAPASDAGPDLGEFARAVDVLDTYNAGASPEDAARAIARRYEADRVDVEMLSEDGGEAVALVTAYGLRDDSVRDERLYLVYAEDEYGTWELADAGRQWRCQPDRGAQDWTLDACL